MINKCTHEICPYTLKPLNELASINNEHIFPRAIGGKLDYSFKTDEKANSDLGSRLDAPLVNAPAIASRRMVHNIKSRSGALEFKLTGNIQEINKPAVVSFSSGEDRIVQVNQSVDFNPSGNHGVIIYGNERQKEKLMKDIGINKKKKNKYIEWESPEDPGKLTFIGESPNLVRWARSMSKIAYAAVYKYLGDDFLSDPLITEWRKLLFAEKDDDAMDADVFFIAFSPADVDAFIPHIQSNQHAAAVFSLGTDAPIAVAVSLFGKADITYFAIASKSCNYGLDVLEGEIAVCNTSSAGTQFINFMEHCRAYTGI